MKEFLIYGIIYLVVVYIFILLVLRAIFFAFVIKADPIKSIYQKKLKIKKESVLGISEQEQKRQKIDKWG